MNNGNFNSLNPFKPITPNVGGFDNFNMNANPRISTNNNQWGMPKNDFNSLDIDSMLKDLDEKFKELDRQEAEKKKLSNNDVGNISNIEDNIELPKKKEVSTNRFFNDDLFDKKTYNNDNVLNPFNVGISNTVKEQNPKVENNEKPKINVDSDSKIVSDNIISDDEFFDDFFGDDE